MHESDRLIERFFSFLRVYPNLQMKIFVIFLENNNRICAFTGTSTVIGDIVEF